MGAIIIKQVVLKLIENHGLRDASVVILAGSSAGGTGVLMNIDRVQNLLTLAGIDAKVRGVVDSAWYLKRPHMDDEVMFRFFAVICVKFDFARKPIIVETML